jgi:hypothetical protein
LKAEAPSSFRAFSFRGSQGSCLIRILLQENREPRESGEIRKAESKEGGAIHPLPELPAFLIRILLQENREPRESGGE